METVKLDLSQAILGFIAIMLTIIGYFAKQYAAELKENLRRHDLTINHHETRITVLEDKAQ